MVQFKRVYVSAFSKELEVCNFYNGTTKSYKIAVNDSNRALMDRIVGMRLFDIVESYSEQNIAKHLRLMVDMLRDIDRVIDGYHDALIKNNCSNTCSALNLRHNVVDYLLKKIEQ